MCTNGVNECNCAQRKHGLEMEARSNDSNNSNSNTNSSNNSDNNINDSPSKQNTEQESRREEVLPKRPYEYVNT
jgi:hypothetical protein